MALNEAELRNKTRRMVAQPNESKWYDSFDVVEHNRAWADGEIIYVKGIGSIYAVYAFKKDSNNTPGSGSWNQLLGITIDISAPATW